MKAYARVQSTHSELLLVLIGIGPELQRLEKLSRELGIHETTRFIGFRRDAARCSNALDIFVLCSDFEGLPLALLDGMAAGCAVIATRVGGVPEVVEDGVTGVLVSPGDVSQLAAAIRKLAEAPDRRHEIGKRAARIVRTRHDLHVVMHQYTMLYQRVVT
jgi:glycosyltransferase involved in cell wall biosynthesis